jgi:hypothetical protein
MMGGQDSAAMAGMELIHQLLASHEKIVRTVENLPDGIRTVTESDDPAVADLIRQHVRSTMSQVHEGSAPRMPMQSEAVRTIIRDSDGISSTVEHTDRGVIVVQTSDHVATVAALQQHASEVIDLVRGGMAAMHEAMMKDGGMIHGGGMMHGGGMTHDTTHSDAEHAEHAAASTETAFAALQARGKEAMGVDQYTSTHSFDALNDGGRIELQRDVDDPAGVAQIREHLRGIAEAFKSGDFSTPAFVHMQQGPGADMMATRRTVIDYTFSELPRGGELRISTRDPAAVGAIHAFLAFQRHDHRTGDKKEHSNTDAPAHLQERSVR